MSDGTGKGCLGSFRTVGKVLILDPGGSYKSLNYYVLNRTYIFNFSFLNGYPNKQLYCMCNLRVPKAFLSSGITLPFNNQIRIISVHRCVTVRSLVSLIVKMLLSLLVIVSGLSFQPAAPGCTCYLTFAHLYGVGSVTGWP